MHRILLILFLFILSIPAISQDITGTIEDGETGEKLFGAAVLEKGTSNGTTTDFDGKFTLKPSGGLPVTLVVTYVGFVKQEIEVTNFEKVKIKLQGENVSLESVTVIESRVTQKQQESPVTVESMDAIAVKETPAVNFYEGLGHLKGVDLTSASMGFKIVNTRGFNSTSPVRSLQLIDGIDNQAPGLNFSVGNFAGANDLDVQRVELIVGANSALYGPNAFNGVISMETKSPFVHRGLTVKGKVGERNLRELGFRYADAHSIFGADYQNIAYKVNFNYMEAYDWVADNYEPTEQSNMGVENPGRYDAVNRYGDENLIPGQNDYNDSRGRLIQPGLGEIYRTGYNEVDLVDYNTKNIKFSPSLHYQFKKKSEIKLAYNYGTGTTVYQGDNRYSLKDLQIHQFIGEFKKKDKFSVRVYRTQEDAGRSYDAVFTALLLQQAAKPDARWSQDYAGYWQRNYTKKVQGLEGFPDPNDPQYRSLWFGDTRDSIYDVVDMILADNNDSLTAWHNDTRNNFADQQGNLSSFLPRYVPGTPEFDSAFNSITSKKTFLEGGSAFYDKSALNHGIVEYQFDKKELGIDWLNIRLGVSGRMYQPNSEGTIFSDTNGRVITNWEVGQYLGVQFRVAKEKLIISATERVDKNENFDPVFSPAASVVYSPKKEHTIRLSYSSAVRNPTLADQYLYYNVGRAILIGNLEGFDSLVTVPSFFDSYAGEAFNRDTLEYFNVDPIRPERVQTIEVGYKGMIGDRLFVDLSYYFSRYRDFIGFIVGGEVDINDSLNSGQLTQVYRVSANSETEVTTQGFSIGLNYYFAKYLALNGNYSWNVLNKVDVDDPILPAYNTPEHKYNIGISGRDIKLNVFGKRISGMGFSVNYKWIEGFLFEGSPQFTGSIPTYDILDAQVSYHAIKLNTTFKLGASNILNKMNFQTYGGPRIGRMAYFSILYELKYL